MSSLTILSNHLENQFNKLQHPGTGMLVPRAGTYYLTNIEYRLIHEATVPVARAYWKPEHDRLFNKSIQFDVALLSFFQHDSTGPKTMLPEDLIGKVVFVNDLALVKDGSARAIVKCNWGIIKMDPQFMTNSDAFLKLVSSSSRTLTECVNNSLNSMGDQNYIDQILEAEAMGELLYEDIEDDYLSEDAEEEQDSTK